MNALPLNVLEVPLLGTHLIEASAGTGKTYTLMRLCIRLLLEGVPCSRILMVTFTEKAAEELELRLLQDLSYVLDYLEPEKDKHVLNLEEIRDSGLESLVDLYVQKTSREHCYQLIQKAFLDRFSLEVYTIHAFCMQTLKEFSLETGFLLDTELITNELLLLEEISKDFWRLQLTQEDKDFFQFVSSISTTKATDSYHPILMAEIFSHLKKGTQCYIHGKKLTLKEKEKWHNSHDTIQEAWNVLSEQEKDELEAFLLANKNGKRKSTIKKYMITLSSYFHKNHNPFHWKDLEMLAEVLQLLEDVDISLSVKCENFWNCLKVYFEATQKFSEALCLHSLYLIEDYVSYLQKELAIRKNHKQVFSYDDLIEKVYYSLTQDENKQHTIQKISQKYSVALIDEFQDTDLWQWMIFKTLFQKEKQGLFMVGDPKQAIYKFRGADIESYLNIRNKVSNLYFLDTNYRSQKSLVENINSIFGTQNAFQNPEITLPSLKAHKQISQLSEESSLEVLFVLEQEEDKANENASKEEVFQTKTISNQDRVKKRILKHLVQEIQYLLEKASLQGKPLSECSNSIVVLTRKNQEAKDCWGALRDAGIGATLHTGISVYNTQEAEDLLSWMKILLDNVKIEGIRYIYSTPSLRHSMQEIQELFPSTIYFSDSSKEENEDLRAMGNLGKIEEILQSFRDYKIIWEKQGLLAMLEKFLTEKGMKERLLKCEGGEETLVNLLHLGELISQEGFLNIYNSYQFLAQKIEGMSDSSSNANIQEEEQIRIELSNRHASVNIMTTHVSKGLEFPIVFCPFFWIPLNKDPKNPITKIYDKETKSYKIMPRYISKVLTMLLEKLGMNSKTISTSLTEYKEKYYQESLEEEIRLLYVALTRASEKLYVYYADYSYHKKSAVDSPLGHVLFPNIHNKHETKEHNIKENKEDNKKDAEESIQYDANFLFTELKQWSHQSNSVKLQILNTLDEGKYPRFDTASNEKQEQIKRKQYLQQAKDSQLKELKEPVAIRKKITAHYRRESFSSLKNNDTSMHFGSGFSQKDLPNLESQSSHSSKLQHLNKPSSAFSFLYLADGQDYNKKTYLVSNEIEVEELTPTNIFIKKEKELEYNFLEFPKGKESGLFLHELIENIDFENLATVPSEIQKTKETISSLLNTHNYSHHWASCLYDLCVRLVSCPLPISSSFSGYSSFYLKDIPSHHLQKETEFLAAFLPENLNDILNQKETPISPHAFDILPQNLKEYSEKNSIKNAQENTKKNIVKNNVQSKEEINKAMNDIFLYGFIDCICLWQQKYYIIDWKSNYLGANLQDYTLKELTKNVEKSQYNLQYYIYLDILDRYCSTSIQNYSYEENFGGVLYIYLRGIDEPKSLLSQTQKPIQNTGDRHHTGIYYDRPSWEQLEAFRLSLLSHI